MAYIQRLQVEAEGFLAGLDIEFKPGLNVIIGARGTGKTSVIELIRFGLNAASFTKKAGEIGEQHARGILEGGAVTIELAEGEDTLAISRSTDAQSLAPRISQRVTILGQSEIEAVGTQASGRLRLIDRYRPARSKDSLELRRLKAEVASHSQQISEVIGEIALLEEQRALIEPAAGDVEAARAELTALTASASVTAEQREQLTLLQSASQQLGAQESSTAESVERTQRLVDVVFAAQRLAEAALPPAALDQGPDHLAESRVIAQEISQSLGRVGEQAKRLSEALQFSVEQNVNRRATIDERSRGLRQALDLVQEGLGAASRKVALLEERMGQVGALTTRLLDRNRALAELTDTRDVTFAELELLRQRIYDERVEVADRLSRSLAPYVRVRVTQSSDIDEYQSTILGLLRGSGIHYNSIAPAIARSVSPIELARWAERGEAAQLASAIDISVDRAATVLGHIKSVGSDQLVTVDVEDEVELSLLDGADFKPTDRLSIGQRCTAVLPVLLGDRGDTLILDQPEDHLDNAFITSTLVKTLQARSDGQYIFASHNANIPVLASADNVIVMASDGERGFVLHQGDLDDPAIVDSISRLMEGGSAAFKTRAAFYESNRLLE